MSTEKQIVHLPFSPHLVLFETIWPQPSYTRFLPSGMMITGMKANRVSGLLVSGLCMVLSSSALASGFTVTLSASDAALACSSKTTPALTFGTPPAGTRALALIMWDQQPGKLTGRWTVYDLPLGTRALKAFPAESGRVLGAPVAVNEAGHLGYTAPCAAGRHDIYIDFYALNVPSLKLPAGAPLQTVHSAIKAHKILEAKAHVTLIVK
ncbi:hypothetical protein [Deinococcus sp. UYEF24]